MKKGFKFKKCDACGKALRGGYAIVGYPARYYHHKCI